MVISKQLNQNNMKATEQITIEKVRELINLKVDKAITDRNATDFGAVRAIRSGMIEAMLDILIMNDPLQVAKGLHLVEVKYILTYFKDENDIVGTVKGEYVSESLCDDLLESYSRLYPETKFVKSIKITEK